MKNKLFIFLWFLVFGEKLIAQNVMINNQFLPNEPSIIIDPEQPNVLLAGANIDNYYISTDTGRTWQPGVLSSSYGVWGDPVLVVDTASHFYFFHLSNPPTGNWIDRIVCQKTTDNGNSWTNGTFTGLNGAKAQDKQWCVVDRTNNHLYMTWTQFDNYGSADPSDSSVILFSKSTDAGNTWSAPQRISKRAGDCLDNDNTVEGAVPAVGVNGEIYVSWAGPKGLVFNKSSDQGATWLNEETRIDTLPGGWDFSVPGIFRANGLPITACDLSNGVNRGTIYVNWTDQRNGSTNTDVWLSKSTDGGQTWSAPNRVNNDNTSSHQFFTWMTIDQTTGYLYFVFYDRRNYTDDSTDVYIAVSMDGGSTFINRKISETAFLPDQNIFFGDYTNITAHNGIIRPIWTRLNNGQLSVWTHLTTHSELVSVANIAMPDAAAHSFSFENYPNPAVETEYISFKLHNKATINLSICDINGKTAVQIIKDEIRGYGKYIERITLKDLNIAAGTYFLKLEIDGIAKTNRMVKY